MKKKKENKEINKKVIVININRTLIYYIHIYIHTVHKIPYNYIAESMAVSQSRRIISHGRGSTEILDRNCISIYTYTHTNTITLYDHIHVECSDPHPQRRRHRARRRRRRR